MLPEEIFIALFNRGYLYRNEHGHVCLNENMFHSNRKFKQIHTVKMKEEKKKRKMYDLDQDDENITKFSQKKKKD